MALYGDAQTNFALKTGAQDVGLIGTYDPRNYQGHTAFGDYQKDCQDIIPSTQTASRITFRTEKNCDHFERLWLCFSILVSVTGGTYKRLVDGFGLHCIDRVELRNGTNTVQIIKPDTETWIRMEKFLENEQRAKAFPMVGLGYTEAQRNTLATASQDFIVPLEFFWRDDISKDPIVPGIQQGLIIDVYLKPAAQVVETDGTVPVLTFSNTVLRTEMIILNESARYQKVAQVTLPNTLNYFYDELASIPEFTVPQGTTSLPNIKLDGLNGPIHTIAVVVRPQSSVSTDLAYKWTDVSTTYNPTTIEIKSNQTSLMRPFNITSFLQPTTDLRCYPGPPSPIIFLVPSENPMSTDTASGHINLQFASNPTMTLTWATATPVAYNVRVYGFGYNWIQHGGGTLKRIFSP